MAPPVSSIVRQTPTALKFSSAKPSGSISAWQLAQLGFARCAASRSRIVSVPPPSLVSSRSGTSAGGGGGGTPSRFSRIHLPRTTGEVRSGYDVTVRMLPWPSRPRRGLSAGSVHAAEVIALDVRQAVEARDALVDERVVGAQQIERAAVLLHDAAEEELRLALEPLPQRVVEVGEHALHGHDGVEVAQVQPLAREVLDERRRALVGEHALHLPLEHVAGRAARRARRPRAARRRGCCSRGRTTAATRA